jgi:hypothetical protein
MLQSYGFGTGELAAGPYMPTPAERAAADAWLRDNGGYGSRSTDWTLGADKSLVVVATDTGQTVRFGFGMGVLSAFATPGGSAANLTPAPVVSAPPAVVAPPAIVAPVQTNTYNPPDFATSAEPVAPPAPAVAPGPDVAVSSAGCTTCPKALAAAAAAADGAPALVLPSLTGSTAQPTPSVPGAVPAAPAAAAPSWWWLLVPLAALALL